MVFSSKMAFFNIFRSALNNGHEGDVFTTATSQMLFCVLQYVAVHLARSVHNNRAMQTLGSYKAGLKNF